MLALFLCLARLVLAECFEQELQLGCVHVVHLVVCGGEVAVSGEDGVELLDERRVPRRIVGFKLVV